MDEAPSPHVPGLFLKPHHLRVAVAADGFGQRIRRVRMNLLHTDHGHVPWRPVSKLLQQVVVHFARTQDHHVGPLRGLRVVDDLLENPSAQFRHGRHRLRITKELLGGEHHQRLPERTVHLASQHVEHVGWRGAVGDNQVVPAAQLKEAFHASAAVFRPHAFVAVGKQQGQPIHGTPLVLSGAQELVPHDLGSVVEVPKLRLPNCQAVRLRKSVQMRLVDFDVDASEKPFTGEPVSDRENCE